jgi:hypothetical protein
MLWYWLHSFTEDEKFSLLFFASFDDLHKNFEIDSLEVFGVQLGG